MTALQQLQLLQQNFQNLTAQKQQLQSQLVEVESALSELKRADKAYRIVGKLMLAADKAVLQKELQEKKELAELRLKHVEKQEGQLQKKIEETQEKMVKEMGKG